MIIHTVPTTATQRPAHNPFDHDDDPDYVPNAERYLAAIRPKEGFEYYYRETAPVPPAKRMTQSASELAVSSLPLTEEGEAEMLRIANDGPIWLRVALAHNDNLPTEIVDNLCRDYLSVALSAVHRPNLSVETAVFLTSHEDKAWDVVASIAARRLKGLTADQIKQEITLGKKTRKSSMSIPEGF